MAEEAKKPQQQEEPTDIYADALRSFMAPVNDLLDNPKVTEIMINGPNEVWIEDKGRLTLMPNKFRDETSLMVAARGIAQYVRRPLDADNPTMDARLPDGSRIHVVIPPCSRKGTTIAIRKFSKVQLTLVDLMNFNSISEEGARFMDACIYLAKNTIVSGGTGSGKTTLLGILAGRTPNNQRILVIEDTAELQIYAPHVVFFETKSKNENGKGEVTIRDLIRSSLRLRPDRIIVGEVRGGEALELVQAMSTGHGGSMGTAHANTPAEACVRLETMCMMSDVELPISAIRSQIGGAINIVIQSSRLSDGSRKITYISEVLGCDLITGRYKTRDIFRFYQTGKDSNGKISGLMLPTGKLPTFWEEIVMNKLPITRDLFDPKKARIQPEGKIVASGH